METRTFFELVKIAYKEIEEAIRSDKCDFVEDFFENTNWSEICAWCDFPDLQVSESIYERAINFAIFIHGFQLSENDLLNINYDKVSNFFKENIAEEWKRCKPIYKNYDSYSCGDDQHLVINGKLESIPIEYYKAIKEGKL